MIEEVTKSAIGIVSGFIGAVVGAFVLQWQSRRQKGFDRTLNWYETQIAAMHNLAQTMEIACTFQEEIDDTEHLKRIWGNVQGKHLAIDTIMQQAPLYASAKACESLIALEERINEVANQTDTFDLADSDDQAATQAVRKLAEGLREAARPLAFEARRHLGIR